MKLLTYVAAVVLGALVGGAIGLAVAFATGIYHHLTAHGDPSAGAAGMLIGLVTVPLGSVIGIPLGVVVARRYVRYLAD
jgi:hypothetical protein